MRAALVATMVAAVSAPVGAVAQATGAPVSVIVVLDSGPPDTIPARAAALAHRHRGSAPRVFTNVLDGFQFEGPANAVAGLRAETGVRTVVEDSVLSLVDVAGYGFFRIDAEVSVNDPEGPYRGGGARVAVIDSGVEVAHRDLAPNLDTANDWDCVRNDAVPDDEHGHGTHVAGIAAAAFNDDGYGVVGVAPEAEILSFKAFDGTGNGATSWILCALDRLAAATQADPMPTALNMSFEDVGTDSACNDADVSDVLHEALCDAVAAGQAAGVPVVPVAAAGNSDIDAAQRIPAAFSDAITVSALADHDGVGGGAAGCPYVPTLFNWECDDSLASFTNWGAAVDLAAPGVDIYSSVPGGHDYLSGTSMAAPHVAGVVALVLAEHAALDTAGVRSLLLRTGECPDGSEAGVDGSCVGQGGWLQTANHSIFEGGPRTEADPDGVAEPLVNAGRAARAADAAGDPPPPPPADAPPSVVVTAPGTGATVSGSLTVAGTSGDDHGVTGIDVRIDGVSIGPATVAGDGSWSRAWDTTSVGDGGHTITAVATDTAAQTTTSAPVSVTVSNAAPPAVMHVGELLGAATTGRKWTATATVRVVDTLGAGVSGATVRVTSGPTTTAAGLSGKPPPPSSGGALSCVTGSDGRCSVTTKPSGGSVRFTITGVTRTGWTYDPGASVDGDPSTPAIDIVVSRP